MLEEDKKQLINLVNLILDKDNNSIKFSDFVKPLLVEGISLFIEIGTLLLIKYNHVVTLAYLFFILSFLVQIAYCFWGMISSIKYARKSKKSFSENLIDNFANKFQKRDLIKKEIKTINIDLLQQFKKELEAEIRNFENDYSLLYEGINNVSLLSLIILFIDKAKEIFDLISKNTDFGILSFLIIVIPLFASGWIIAQKSRIGKYKLILSYMD